jgi:SWI/SNF-related matrix-associated actin-dependent regulator of chromatin subfamily A member 5
VVVLHNLVGLYDVVVTTYDMLKHPSMQFNLVSSIYWRCVVLDEGHIIRTEGTTLNGNCSHNFTANS